MITNGLTHAPPVLAPADGSVVYYTPFDYTHSQAIASAASFDYSLIDPTTLLGELN